MQKLLTFFQQKYWIISGIKVLINDDVSFEQPAPGKYRKGSYDNDLKAIILLEVFEMRCQSHRLMLEMIVVILSTNQPHHLYILQYCISSVIRRDFFLQINPKNLDMSYKTDLDFGIV